MAVRHFFRVWAAYRVVWSGGKSGLLTFWGWHLDSDKLKAEHHTASAQVELLDTLLPLTGERYQRQFS